MWNSEYKSLQGNIGLGRAIAHYTSLGINISIPLNDTQKYDLIIDRESVLYRVSVKTSSFKSKANNYYVMLQNSGGSSGKSKTKPFSNLTCDLLFILTSDGNTFEIPSKDIRVTRGLTMTKTIFEKYKL